VKLGWEEARALRLERHQLHRRAPRGRELRIAGRICGLHAQLLSSAALSLWARVEGTSLEAFQRALWRDRTLVKIWAMRGTLHLLPARDLPIYLGALGTYRHYLGQGWVKYFGVTREEIELVIETVGEVLRNPNKEGQLRRGTRDGRVKIESSERAADLQRWILRDLSALFFEATNEALEHHDRLRDACCKTPLELASSSADRDRPVKDRVVLVLAVLGRVRSVDLEDGRPDALLDVRNPLVPVLDAVRV